MRPLRLMAEYDCFPLWESFDGLHNVDPFELPIPGGLANAVIEWSDEYTVTLNRSDPATSGFADAASAEAWLRNGAAIANRLRENGLEIDYFHERHSASDLVAREQ